MNYSQKTNDVSFIYDKVMCVKLPCFGGKKSASALSVLGRKVKTAR
jgi:hypothetical protein